MAIFTETFGFICSIHGSSNLKIEIELKLSEVVVKKGEITE